MKTILLFLLLFTGISFAQNNALNFDGVNDYVSLPLFDFSSGSFTIEMWINANNLTTNENNNLIRQQPETGLPDFEINFGTYGTSLIFGLNTSSSGYSELNVNVTPANYTGSWHHLAVVYNGSTMKTYDNGIEIGSLSKSGSPVVSNNNTLNQLSGYRGASELFNGKMDEVRIWNGARTASEIRQNMYRELSDPSSETNLLAYYKFNETTGTTAANAQGNATYNGTLTNMTGGEWQTSSAIFGPKNCLEFDGSNDYVSIPGTAANTTSAFTVEFWMKMDNTPLYYEGIVDKNAELNRNWYFYTVQGAQAAMFGIGGAQLWFGLNDYNWHFIAGTYNGSTMKVYVDGKFIASANIAMTTDPSIPITIGKRQSSPDRYFKGKVDELRLWSIERSNTEIAKDMCKSLTGNEDNLVAYYSFDNNRGTTLQDFTSNMNDGALVNMDNSDWVSSSAFNTWLNTTSPNWSTSSNWSRGSVPGIDDNIGVYSYSGGSDLSINTGFVYTPVHHMLLSRTGTQKIETTGMAVTGNLIVQSDLNLGINSINLGNSGYLIEGGGLITGNEDAVLSRSGSLGTVASDNFGGLGLYLTSSSSIGSISMARGFKQQTGSGLTNGISRYYTINIQNAQSINFVFNYLDSEVPGTESNLGLYYAPQSGDGPGEWTKLAGAFNNANNTITYTGLNLPSYQTYWLTAADDPSLLPVELTSFNASVLNNTVILNWQTATEVNNYGFEVERSVISNLPAGRQAEVRNLSWKKIGFVNGNGNSNSPKEYSFVDNKLSTGKYSYRLKQIDNDGQFEYSKTIEVDLGTPDKFELSQNYPNPFNPTTKINWQSPVSSWQTLKVYNLLGKEVVTLVNENREAGTYEIDFNASNLPSGVYVYKLQAGSFTQTRKMTLIK